MHRLVNCDHDVWNDRKTHHQRIACFAKMYSAALHPHVLKRSPSTSTAHSARFVDARRVAADWHLATR
jgi:hypothetical protein